MADRLSKEERSRLMAQVKTQGTAPELTVRSYLHAAGLRFRLHRRSLPGSPDVVLPKYRAVVFVHGCFWHQHPGCLKAALPKTNTEFWEEKLRKNSERDLRVESALTEENWRVFILWECDLREPRLRRLVRGIKGLK